MQVAQQSSAQPSLSLLTDQPTLPNRGIGPCQDLAMASFLLLLGDCPRPTL